MRIPIIKAGDPSEYSTCPPVYIVGRDGFYLKKSTPLFDAVVKVGSIPDYEEVKEEAVLKVPMIPWTVIKELHEFFQAVYHEYEGEAIALLTLKDGIWGTLIPEQTVSSAHLDYRITGKDIPRHVAGTVHSHCDMGAFFSPTDEKDHYDMDGIHIVLGRINMTVPEIKSAVSVNGRIFDIEPDELIDGIPEDGSFRSDHPWMQKVTRKKSKHSARPWDRFGCKSQLGRSDEESEPTPYLYEESEEDLLWNAY